MEEESLWSLVSDSFRKFPSCPAIKFYGGEPSESCLCLTYADLFRDSDIVRRELLVANKRSPVAFLFPDDTAEIMPVYSSIIAAIRLD